MIKELFTRLTQRPKARRRVVLHPFLTGTGPVRVGGGRPARRPSRAAYMLWRPLGVPGISRLRRMARAKAA